MKPFVAIVRMSSIGDILMTADSVSKLSLSGYRPVLVTDFKFLDVAKTLNLLDHLLLRNEQGEFFYFYRQNVDNVWMIQNNIESIIGQIGAVIDLQCTSRSRKAIKELKFDGLKIWSVNKRSIFRIWIVVKAYIKSIFERPNYFVNPLLGSHNAEKHVSFVFDKESCVSKVDPYVINEQLRVIDKFIKCGVGLLKTCTLADNKNLLCAVEDSQKPHSEMPYICLFPGASAKTKQWPAEHFTALLLLILKNSNFDVKILGGKDDQLVCNQICNATSSTRVTNETGALKLDQTLGYLAKSRGFVSNDSFPGHGAMLQNIPGVVLFGSTSPEFGFRPNSINIASIWLGLPCSPCSRHGAQNCRYSDLACLTLITPQLVFEELMSVIKQNESPSISCSQ